MIIEYDRDIIHEQTNQNLTRIHGVVVSAAGAPTISTTITRSEYVAEHTRIAHALHDVEL